MTQAARQRADRRGHEGGAERALRRHRGSCRATSSACSTICCRPRARLPRKWSASCWTRWTPANREVITLYYGAAGQCGRGRGVTRELADRAVSRPGDRSRRRRPAVLSLHHFSRVTKWHRSRSSPIAVHTCRRPPPLPNWASRCIPLIVRAGQQTYPERINQTDEAFMRRLAPDSKSVTVESPSVAHVQQLFARLGQVTDSVVCIHASGAFPTCRDRAPGVVRLHGPPAHHRASTRRPRLPRWGSSSRRPPRAAAERASQAEVVKIVRGMIPHMYAMFFSDSLEFLEAWGRLGPAQTLLGTMLDLKPLATMEDGDLIPMEKVRTLQPGGRRAVRFRRRVLAHRAAVPGAPRLRGRGRAAPGTAGGSVPAPGVLGRGLYALAGGPHRAARAGRDGLRRDPVTG